MRIAHLIMAHKNPVQLARLIHRLQHPQFDFYVHVDAKVSIDDFDFLKEIPNVTFVKHRINCNWGGFSFVQAIFSTLNEAMNSRSDYAFINLLSAQDYPARSADHLYDFLNSHQGKNFISFDTSNDSDWWKDAKNRYEKYHLTDLKIKGKYFIQKLLNAFSPARKFPGGLQLYGSSDSSWWTISGECAAYINDKLKNEPKLSSFLKLCWGTDEFVIATLVMNSPFKGQVINDNLRYIDWSEGHAHPKLLGMADLGRIVSSGKLFARKFDNSIDEKILDRLDQLH